MKRRVDSEVRLAQARDALFRKRSDLKKISPADINFFYEEFGREAVVRGELMAAISAAVEATAVEKECVHLENVMKTRGESPPPSSSSFFVFLAVGASLAPMSCLYQKKD